MMSKTVIAQLTVKPSEVERFTALAQRMVSKTRQEKGCIVYHLYKACLSEKPQYLFYEEYRDEDALNFHNNSDYLKSFFESVAPLLDGEPSIKVIN